LGVLDILVLLVLLLLVATAVYALYFLGGWPGRVARERDHPQADAVGVCGWLGLLTGVFWIVAMVWAFLRLPGSTGTSAASMPQRLEGLESRLAVLEAKLAASGGDRS